MHYREFIAQNLAAALLAVEWREEPLNAALIDFLGAQRRRRGNLARRLVEIFPVAPAPARLVAFLRETNLFRGKKLPPPKIILAPPAFSPAPRFASLDIPKLATPGEIADWLKLTPAELDWFADRRRIQAKEPGGALAHYRFRFIAKRAGPPRLLEAPKPRLKAIQRRILHEILDHAPTHGAAFGFVRGRSCVEGAARHAGERFVIAFDLKDFFTTTPMRRVYALFRSLGYPHAAADLLTRLCGCATPREVFEILAPAQRHDFETRKRFTQLHLPQGAPTSPALANLVAFRLDVRLAGLARHFDAAYSRYADDLTFSGDDAFAARSKSFAAAVAAIAHDEGFSLNARKTRAMRAHQRQAATGVVINSHVNVGRDAYDRLKATLHNCARHGPQAQNRDAHPQFRAHLDGRVAWVEQLNPARGGKLRRLFDRIDWGVQA